MIEDTSRDTAAAFMKMNQYVDVLIPRGGAGLIRAVVNQATIPVIETGTGNCHIFVDETADFDMNFCRGNKGYLINLAHVDGITDGCAMVKGERLVLSRARKKEFMEELTKYWGEVIK